MNENTALSIFNYHDNEVRTVILNNEIYFVVADICKVLEISNVSMAVGRLDQDGVSQAEVIDSLGRKQTAAIANEPNLYRLIFRSEKPEAKAFQDWVYKEVLPAIRKTGSYNPSGQLDGNALDRIAQLERTVSSLVEIVSQGKQLSSGHRSRSKHTTFKRVRKLRNPEEMDRRIIIAINLFEKRFKRAPSVGDICNWYLRYDSIDFTNIRMQVLLESGVVQVAETSRTIRYSLTPLQGE